MSVCFRSQVPHLFACLAWGVGLLLVAVLSSFLTFDRASAAEAEPPSKPGKPVPCGGWGTECYLPADRPDGTLDANQMTVLSYGAKGGGWQNVIFSGLRQVRCQWYAGDQGGGDKQCVSAKIDLPKVDHWNDCASGSCSITVSNPNAFRIIRYGATSGSDSRWMYMYAAKDTKCVHNDFGGMEGDPFPNVAKKCQVSSNEFTGKPGASWTVCTSSGASGQVCQFPNSGNYLVRYGPIDLSWATYRIVTGTGIDCREGPFNWNAAASAASANYGKRCDYLPLPQIARVSGAWDLVGMCLDCGDISYNVTVGVEQGKSRESETSWSLELSTSFRTGNDESPTGTETSFTASYGARDLIAQSFTKSQGTEFAITCDKGALWQWTTAVENVCFPGSTDPNECLTIARSKMFKCMAATDDPGDEPVQVGTQAAAADPAPAPPPPTQVTSPTGALPPSSSAATERAQVLCKLNWTSTMMTAQSASTAVAQARLRTTNLDTNADGTVTMQEYVSACTAAALAQPRR